jgi:hypothetical protein
MRHLLISAALLLVATSTQADIVTDSIAAASEAYAAGDMGAASNALKAAMDDIGRQQGAILAAILPPAPEGFTRTDSADFTAGMAMFGGGSGAEASYSKADATFTISIMADNELVGGMMGMFSDPGMLAMMGTVDTVGDVNIVTATDGSIMSIVAGRYMISAQGSTPEVMLPIVKAIDFAKLTEMAGQ